MISIEQWRVSIGMNGRSRTKQTSATKYMNGVDPETFDCQKILKISRKSLFATFITFLTIFSLQEQNPMSKCMAESNLGEAHKAVIDVLLVIGGVEINPGPQTVPEIIGQLIVDAPTDNVKKTLNRVRSDVDRKDNIKNLLKTGKDSPSVEDLKTTCSFLYNSTDGAFDEYLKEGLAETIVYRMNQLYPESCTTCTKSYAIHRTDTPSLQCYNCDKGCCPPCGEKYVNNLKSCGLNDVFWTCSTCTESRKVFINEEVAKLKKKSKTNKNESSKNDAEKAEENTTEEAAEEITKATEVESTDSDEVILVEAPAPTKPPTSQKTALCKFYRNNKCKYGISGKGCQYRHEPPCSRIIKHGLGGRYGCNSKCEKFHPKMCRTSLQNRECFRDNCTFKHLPNTKRKKETVQKVNTPKENPKEVKKVAAKPKAPTNDAEKDNSFLEELKKEVLQQVLLALGGHGSGHGQNPQKAVPIMNLPLTQQWMQQPMMRSTVPPPMMMMMNPMIHHQ